MVADLNPLMLSDTEAYDAATCFQGTIYNFLETNCGGTVIGLSDYAGTDPYYFYTTDEVYIAQRVGNDGIHQISPPEFQGTAGGRLHASFYAKCPEGHLDVEVGFCYRLVKRNGLVIDGYANIDSAIWSWECQESKCSDRR